MLDIKEFDKFVYAITQKRQYISKNIVICSPDLLAKLMNVEIKIGYAPIAIAANIPEDEKSFVELDYYPRRCINLLRKENGIGQIGGKAMEGIARQPSATGDIRTNMIVAAALVEGAALFAIVVALLVLFV